MRTKRTNGLPALLAVAVSVWAPAPASAQVSTWSVTGAGCVPTGQTISGIGTFNPAGDVKFPGAGIGEIIVTCPVPSSLPSATHLAVTYRDSDGPRSAVLLRAVLRRKRLDVGGAQDVRARFSIRTAFRPRPPMCGSRSSSPTPAMAIHSCSITPGSLIMSR